MRSRAQLALTRSHCQRVMYPALALDALKLRISAIAYPSHPLIRVTVDVSLSSPVEKALPFSRDSAAQHSGTHWQRIGQAAYYGR
jgi:hypothetical protein